MGRWAMVVGCPLVEMIRDVKGGWVWGSVFKVDDDDLCVGINDQNLQVRTYEKKQTWWWSGAPSIGLFRRRMLPYWASLWQKTGRASTRVSLSHFM